MNNEKCAVVRDLLPLYVDEACGEESREFVREHLAGCAACQRVLARLQARQPVETPAVKDLPMVEVFRILKKSIRFQRVRNAVFVAILAIVFTIATILLYQALFHSYNVEVPFSEMGGSGLQITSQGEILFDLNAGGRNFYMTWTPDYEEYELVYRVALMRPPLQWPGRADHRYELIPSGIYILEDGKAYSLDDRERGHYYFDEKGRLFVRDYGYWDWEDDWLSDGGENLIPQPDLDWDDEEMADLPQLAPPGTGDDWEWADGEAIPPLPAPVAETEEEPTYSEREPIGRIYAGTGGDGVVLWEEGMEITPCSPAADRHFTRDYDGYG